VPGANILILFFNIIFILKLIARRQNSTVGSDTWPAALYAGPTFENLRLKSLTEKKGKG
jgi:hypothetical protein